MIKATLLMAKKERFISLSPDPGNETRKINGTTEVTLDVTFFEAIKKYGQQFRAAFADQRLLPHDDLSIYKRVNGFLKDT